MALYAVFFSLPSPNGDGEAEPRYNFWSLAAGINPWRAAPGKPFSRSEK